MTSEIFGDDEIFTDIMGRQKSEFRILIVTWKNVNIKKMKEMLSKFNLENGF